MLAFTFVSRRVQTYYLNRSQPPVLAAMVEVYISSVPREQWPTNFVEDALAALQSEHSYWTCAERLVVLTSTGARGQQHSLARYNADWTQPRPESYKCDTCLLMQGVSDSWMSTASRTCSVFRCVAHEGVRQHCTRVSVNTVRK